MIFWLGKSLPALIKKHLSESCILGQVCSPVLLSTSPFWTFPWIMVPKQVCWNPSHNSLETCFDMSFKCVSYAKTLQISVIKCKLFMSFQVKSSQWFLLLCVSSTKTCFLSLSIHHRLWNDTIPVTYDIFFAKEFWIFLRALKHNIVVLFYMFAGMWEIIEAYQVTGQPYGALMCPDMAQCWAVSQLARQAEMDAPCYL